MDFLKHSISYPQILEPRFARVYLLCLPELLTSIVNAKPLFGNGCNNFVGSDFAISNSILCYRGMKTPEETD